MWRWVGTVVVAILGAFWLIGTDAPEGATTGDRAAAAALVAVTTATFDPAHPSAAFPAEWEQTMGYQPQVAVGPAGRPVLIKPTGDCSAPTGPTAYNFDTVCKEHDLSYDVLRYAGIVGRPLPASSRQAADDMFDRELHGRCTQQGVVAADFVLCHAFAESFTQVVKINSWRQGYQPPGVESPWRWSALTLFFGALICLPLSVRRMRLMHQALPWHPASMLPSRFLPAHISVLPVLHADLAVTMVLVRRLLAGRRPVLLPQLFFPDRVTQTSHGTAQSKMSPSEGPS